MSSREVGSRLLESPTASRRRLVAELDRRASSGDGRLVVVRGMPGSGVTTVVRGLLAARAAAGAQTAYVVLEQMERGLPFAVIDRLQDAAPWIRDTTTALDPAADPLQVGQWLVEAMGSHTNGAGRGRVIALDSFEHCDDASAGVLRFAVSRIVARGAVVVIGQSLAESTGITGHAAARAADGTDSDLVTLDDLTIEEISALVQERAGVGISTPTARHIRQLTQGRFAAVSAYLAGISDAEFANLAAIRVLPRATAARLRPHWCLPFEDLPLATIVAAEASALAGRGVAVPIVDAALSLLGAHPRPPRIADGDVVELNSVAGTLHLGDPLAAGDVLAHADPDRLRVIGKVLADSTYGLDASLYRLRAQEPTRQTADRVLQTAAELEAAGKFGDAMALLDAARWHSRGGDQYPRLLRAFGLATVRLMAIADYQSRLVEFAVEPGTDPYAEFVYSYLRTAKAHGRTEARQLRLDYMAQAPVSDDHRLMQAEIAIAEFYSAFQTGDGTAEAAYGEARRRIEALVGTTATDPGLTWLRMDSRLAFLDAFATVGALQHQPPGAARPLIDQMLARARTLPETGPERSDILVLGAMCLARLNELEAGHAVIKELAHLRPGLTRPLLLDGQRAVTSVDLEVRRGDWALAREVLRGALPRVSDGLDMPTRVVLPALQAWLLAAGGELDEARRFLDIAVKANQYRYRGHGHAWLVLARAEILRQTGDPAGAAACVQKDLPDLLPSERWWVMSERTESLAQAGMADAAAASLQELREYVEEIGLGIPGLLAFHAGSVALAGRDAESAVTHYRTALEGLEHPFLVAKCRLALGLAYHRIRGAHMAAVGEVTTARTTLEQLGAGAYAELADRLLTHMDKVRSRRLELLSARERHVAELAARRWTNREISEELRVSVATVAFHVSNVLKKLGLSRRTEIGGALHAPAPAPRTGAETLTSRTPARERNGAAAVR